jgi:RNA polymerase sigma factor (sigma-70 family)
MAVSQHIRAHASGGDDAALARLAGAGDGAAFATLYDRHERRIYNFCLRMLGSPHDAADATQETFLKVLSRLPQLESRQLDFVAYLFTAARNACYDQLGRRKRAQPVEELPEPDPEAAPGDIYVDPERAAMLTALQDDVQAANARLPERQREVLVLREVEELSYDDIGTIMGLNRNAVAQLVSRARIKLRDELRGGALASVAGSTEECERALPLLALRQDGQLRDAEQRSWLAAHVGGCETCRVSQAAMQEAGLSYRAWVPLLPLVWLRHATIAKAADLVGANWSAHAGQGPSHAGDAGSSGGSPGGGGAGAGSGPGGAASAGAGAPSADAAALVTPGAASSSGPGTAAALDAATVDLGEERKHRRRRGLVALLALLLLLAGVLGGIAVGGGGGGHRSVRATVSTPLGPVAVTPSANDSAAGPPRHPFVRRRHRRPVIATTPTATTPTPTTAATVSVATATTVVSTPQGGGSVPAAGHHHTAHQPSGSFGAPQGQGNGSQPTTTGAQPTVPTQTQTTTTTTTAQTTSTPPTTTTSPSCPPTVPRCPPKP